MDHFFGGSPAMVFLRLIIISLIVGIIMAALGVDAFDLVTSFRNLVLSVYNMGFDAFHWLLSYFLLGAVVVFPIWFIVRLIKTARRKDIEKS